MRLTYAAPLLAFLLAAPASAQEPGRREPSLSELEALARTDSNDAIAQYRLAMGYWDHKQWDNAERALRQALAVAPSYADAHLALGVLPDRRGEDYWKERVRQEGEDRVRARFEESATHFRRAFLLDPLVDLRVLDKFREHRTGLYRTGDRAVLVIEPWWGHDFVESANEFRTGRYWDAFERLDKLVMDRRFGGSNHAATDILWFHGLAAAHLARFGDAIRDFAVLTRRAMDKDSVSAMQGGGAGLRGNDYKYLLATMLYLAKQYDQAIPMFRSVLETDLGLYTAHVQLARMYEERDSLDAALGERRLALDVQQNDPDLLIDLAGTLLKAGRPGEALAPLADAARINPHDARVPYLEASVAESLHDSATARLAYTRFIAIAPSRFAEQVKDAEDRLQALSGRGIP